MKEIKLLEYDYLEVCVDKQSQSVIISNRMGESTYIDKKQIDSVMESLEKAKSYLDQ